MNLISQWYEPECKQRSIELYSCRIAAESSVGRLLYSATYLDGTRERKTFNELFDYAADRFRGQPCIIANSDIAFDYTILIARGLCRPNRIVSLTRWETPKCPAMWGHAIKTPSAPVTQMFFSGCQDAWCFVGGEIESPAFDIPMGVPGCDQILAGWAACRGIEFVNPSFDVRISHVHENKNQWGDHEAIKGIHGYPEITSSMCGEGNVLLSNTLNEGPSIQLSIVRTVL